MAIQKERRAAARKPTDKDPATAKDVPKRTAKAPASGQLSNEDLYKLIAETAYFKAKAREFAPGGEVQDWIEAEAEVHMRVSRDSRTQ